MRLLDPICLALFVIGATVLFFALPHDGARDPTDTHNNRSLSFSYSATPSSSTRPIRSAVLVIGQSNAIGVNSRPTADDFSTDYPTPNIYSIETGVPAFRWYEAEIGDSIDATNPLPLLGHNRDDAGGGLYSVSFALEFARQWMVDDPNQSIWIANAAQTGSSFRFVNDYGSWQWNHTQPAIETSSWIDSRIDFASSDQTHRNRSYANDAADWFSDVIQRFEIDRAVLLVHQGEGDIALWTSDYAMEPNPDYARQLDETLGMLRSRIGVHNTSILVGTLLPHLYESPHVGGHYVRDAHFSIEQRIEHARVVDCSSLDAWVERDPEMSLRLVNGSYVSLHYSADGQRRMGRLFYDVFRAMRCDMCANKSQPL